MNAPYGAGSGGLIPVVDLRHEYADLMCHSHFNDFVRDRAVAVARPDRPTPGLDLRQLVVIDDANALVAHSDALARILNASTVKQVVCVAIGMARPDDHVAVSIPSILRVELATVLWIGDPYGISWLPGVGPDPVIRPTPGEVGEGDPAPLREFLEALTTPDVFEQVTLRVAEMPAGVAVPGVRLASSRLSEQVLALAQARVLGELASGVGRVGVEGVGTDIASAGDELARMSQRIGTVNVTALGGPLGAARDQVANGIGSIDGLLRRVERPWGLLSALRDASIPRLFAHTVDGLVAYGETLSTLFGEADNGTDDQRRSRLRAEGIALADAPTAAPAPVEEVRHWVLSSIEVGRPVDQTVEQLYGIANRLTPPGSAARLPQVEGASPPHLMRRLAAPPPMPNGFGGWLVPAGMLVAPLLAAAHAETAAFTVSITGLTSLLGAVAVRRKRHRIGQTKPTWWRDIGAVLSVLVLVLLGTGVALGIAPAGATLPGQVAWTLVGTGLLLSAIVPFLWWHSLVRPWRQELPLTELRGVERSLHDIWDETSTEWVLTDTRRRASDTVRALASALEAIGNAMTDHARVLLDREAAPAAGRGEPGTETVGVTIGAVGAVLRHDLTELVLTVMEDHWAEARQHDLAGMPKRAAHRTAQRLAEYDAHLRRWGIQDPPPGWPLRTERERLTIGWWRDDDQLVQAVSVTRPVRQLCSYGQTSLLSHEVSSVTGTVRFAPRSARLALTESSPVESAERRRADGEVVWTESGAAAGVLNLVPLKAGVEHRQLVDAGGLADPEAR